MGRSKGITMLIFHEVSKRVIIGLWWPGGLSLPSLNTVSDDCYDN